METAPCSDAFKINATLLKAAEDSGDPYAMLLPSETSKAAPLIEHAKTADTGVLLVYGELKGGKREFAVPVDSTMQLLTLSIFIQCLGSVTVVDPAGTQVGAGPHVEQASFHSGQLMNVTEPQTGLWRIRVEGSGTYAITAMAKSTIRFTGAEFAGNPLKAGTQKLQAVLQGDFSTVQFVLMTMDGMPSVFKMAVDPNKPGGFTGDVVLPPEPFRIIAEGADNNGLIYRRFFPTLFHPVPE